MLVGGVAMDAAFYFPSVDATPAVTKIREGAITKIRESATNGYQLLPHPQLLCGARFQVCHAAIREEQHVYECY